MQSFVAFAIAIGVSLVASQVAALQLAIVFHARDEFVLVMVALGLFGVISIATLALTFIASDRTRAIDLAGAALVAAAVVVTGGFLALTAFLDDGPWIPTPYDIQIMTEFLLPALLLVLIQWGIVRWRRVRALKE